MSEKKGASPFDVSQWETSPGSSAFSASLLTKGAKASKLQSLQPQVAQGSLTEEGPTPLKGPQLAAVW